MFLLQFIYVYELNMYKWINKRLIKVYLYLYVMTLKFARLYKIFIS